MLNRVAFYCLPLKLSGNAKIIENLEDASLKSQMLYKTFQNHLSNILRCQKLKNRKLVKRLRREIGVGNF